MATRWSFQATGTTWTIDIYEPHAANTSSLKARVARRVGEFDKNYSRFRADSLVAQLALESGEYKLPTDAQGLLGLYQNLYDSTNGKLTPLIGQSLIDAGYDADYSLIPKATLAKPLAWEEVLDHTSRPGWLRMKRPAQLDFGAIGKGYLVDIVSELLREQGIRSFCVDAGGDLFYDHSGQPAVIGLEDPEHEGAIVGQARFSIGALCGSAGNRRRWAGYHHTIDPATSSSPEDIKAIWVYTNSAALADGLTTALNFVPAKILKKQYNFEYVLLMADGTAEVSADFPGKLFD